MQFTSKKIIVIHSMCLKYKSFKTDLTWIEFGMSIFIYLTNHYFEKSMDKTFLAHLYRKSYCTTPGIGVAVLALTVKFRKSQEFLILISGSPGNQIVSLTSKHLTSIFLNSHLWSKTAIFKLNNIQILSINGQISLKLGRNGQISLKLGSPRLPGTDFWKSRGNFWESLTPRLPLMQALELAATSALTKMLKFYIKVLMDLVYIWYNYRCVQNFIEPYPHPCS